MTFLFAYGMYPVQKTPLVELLTAPRPYLVADKLPKSDAFPNDDIVKNCISSVLGDPPPVIALVLLEVPARRCVAVFRLPKSCAFPKVLIVTKSIMSVYLPI